MKKSELIPISTRQTYQLWKALSEEEQKVFLRDWITNTKFKLILKQFGREEDPQRLWEKAFGKEVGFNPGSFRVYLRKISQQLENYLIIKEVKSNPAKEKYYLASQLFKSENPKLVHKYLNEAEKQLAKNDNRDTSFIQQYLAHLLLRTKLDRRHMSEKFPVVSLNHAYTRHAIWLETIINTIEVWQLKQLKGESHTFEEDWGRKAIEEIRQQIEHPTEQEDERILQETNEVFRSLLYMYDVLKGKEFDFYIFKRHLARCWSQIDLSTLASITVIGYNRLNLQLYHDPTSETADYLRQHLVEALDRGWIVFSEGMYLKLLPVFIRTTCITLGGGQAREYLKRYVGQQNTDGVFFYRQYVEVTILFFEGKFEKMLSLSRSLVKAELNRATYVNLLFFEIGALFQVGLEEIALQQIENLKAWLKDRPSAQRVGILNPLNRLELLRKMMVPIQKGQHAKAYQLIKAKKLPYFFASYFLHLVETPYAKSRTL